MNITIHIERLILDGLPIAHRDRPRLQSAIEEELTSLLVYGSLVIDLSTPGTLSRLTGDTLEFIGDEEPYRLGKRIAQSIYGGIGQ